MRKLVKRLFKEEEGQGLVEYGLIIALVAIVAAVGLFAVSDGLKDVFERIGSGLEDPEALREG